MKGDKRKKCGDYDLVVTRVRFSLKNSGSVLSDCDDLPSYLATGIESISALAMYSVRVSYYSNIGFELQSIRLLGR